MRHGGEVESSSGGADTRMTTTAWDVLRQESSLATPEVVEQEPLSPPLQKLADALNGEGAKNANPDSNGAIVNTDWNDLSLETIRALIVNFFGESVADEVLTDNMAEKIKEHRLARWMEQHSGNSYD
ncbi:MAG: hypothetical protein ACM3JF_01145 [Sphaerimonospora mesophila]